MAKAKKFTAFVAQLGMVAVLLAALAGSANAAAGDLDTSFGSPKGFVTTDISTATDEANAVAVQADGKIIAAGYSSYGGITARDFTLVRYSAAGVPDSGFGLGGKKVTAVANGNLNDLINAIALQTDGNIVVAGPVNISGGKSVFGVARYLSATGALDPSFGSGGIVTTSLSLNNDIPTALVIQSDHKIVVGGSANGNFAVARYTATGALDTATFGAGTVLITWRSVRRESLKWPVTQTWAPWRTPAKAPSVGPRAPALMAGWASERCCLVPSTLSVTMGGQGARMHCTTCTWAIPQTVVAGSAARAPNSGVASSGAASRAKARAAVFI